MIGVRLNEAEVGGDRRRADSFSHVSHAAQLWPRFTLTRVFFKPGGVFFPFEAGQGRVSQHILTACGRQSLGYDQSKRLCPIPAPLPVFPVPVRRWRL